MLLRNALPNRYNALLESTGTRSLCFFPEAYTFDVIRYHVESLCLGENSKKKNNKNCINSKTYLPTPDLISNPNPHSWGSTINHDCLTTTSVVDGHSSTKYVWGLFNATMLPHSHGPMLLRCLIHWWNMLENQYVDINESTPLLPPANSFVVDNHTLTKSTQGLVQRHCSASFLDKTSSKTTPPLLAKPPSKSINSTLKWILVDDL